jgi:hypothetical protein
MFGNTELTPDIPLTHVIHGPEKFLLVKVFGKGGVGVKKSIHKKSGSSKLVVKPIFVGEDPLILQNISALQSLSMEQFANSLSVEDLMALNETIISSSRTGNLDVLASRYIKHLPEYRALKVGKLSVKLNGAAVVILL